MASSIRLLSGDIVLVELNADYSLTEKKRKKYALWINSGNGYFFLINTTVCSCFATESICLSPQEIPCIKKKCYLNLAELLPRSRMCLTEGDIKKIGTLPDEYMVMVKQKVENSKQLQANYIKLIINSFDIK